MSGMRSYTNIAVPALVVFANPHGQGRWADSNSDPKLREAAKAYSAALGPLTERQMKVVEQSAPAAHVVQLPGAHHYVYLSNEAEVLREMFVFLASLH
jgi:hypothetical protein